MADVTPAPASNAAPASTTPAAPADGATPPIAAAPEAQAPVTRQDALTQIDETTDLGQLENLLDAAHKGEVAASEAPTTPQAPTPAPATPASDGSTPPPAAAPEATPGDDTEDDTKPLPKNFRLHTEDPQRAAFLRILAREPGTDPIAAAQRAGYRLPEFAPSTAPTPAAPLPDPLQPLRDEIATLKADKVAARKAYDFDRADEIGDTILEKTLALERAAADNEAQQAYEQEYGGAFGAARSAAVQKYPDTAVKGTPQFEEISRERAYLEQTEPGFFDDPEYPMELVSRLEKRRPDLFKAGATPPATPPSPPNQPVSPPAARPVGQVVPGNNTAVPPLNRQQAVEAIDNLDLEELEALADKVGTPAGRGANVHR